MDKPIHFILKPTSYDKPCLPSLNQYITICRANKWGANAWKHRHQEIIGKQIAEQCDNFYIDKPFTLDLVICEGNKRRDKDNVEAMAKKLILDTLENERLISNDKLYNGGNTTFTYEKNNSHIIVEIEKKSQ